MCAAKTQNERQSLAEALSQTFGSPEQAEAHRQHIQNQETRKQKSFFDLAFDKKNQKVA